MIHEVIGKLAMASSEADPEASREKFLEVIADGDFDKVRAMIEVVQDLNEVFESIAPLQMAIECNNIGIAKLLMEHGAEIPTCKTKRFDIFYHVICYTKNEEMVRLLLSLGVAPYEVFEKYHKKTNGFLEAVETHDHARGRDAAEAAKAKNILDLLLEHDDGLGEPEEKGPYALRAAIALKDADLVRKYLDDGVRIERCYDLRIFPLLAACTNNDLDTAALLLEHGANPDEIESERPPDSPLKVAMGHDDMNIDLVRLLLDKGADDCAMPIYCETTMHQTDDRLTGLMFACAFGLPDIVKEVIARGRDVNAINEEVGCTALYYCNDSVKTMTFCPRLPPDTNLAIIEELLKAGARCDLVNPMYGDGQILTDFLSSVIIQHDYQTSNMSGITAPALMLKACGTCCESPEPYLNVMSRYLEITEEQRAKIFQHEKSFSNFNCIFHLFVLCGNRPNHIFVEKYREVVLKGTGREDGTGWLNDIAQKGFSLKQLTRIKLRQMIRHPLVTNALSDTIPLPPLLKKYIIFDDILPFQT